MSRVGLDRPLLRVEHVGVLAEDPGHSLAEQVGQALVVQVVVPPETPEVVGAAGRGGRHGIERVAVDAGAPVTLRGTGPGRRDTDIDGDRRGSGVADDLPPVDGPLVVRVLAAQLHAEEGWRLDSPHPPGERDRMVVVGHVGFGFRELVVGEAVGVQELLVGEVHEVVEDQPVVAVDSDGPAVPGPLRIVVPVQVRNEIGIGHRGIAQPDPDEPVPLHDRVRSDRGGGVERLLGRHPGAAAMGPEGEAVVATDHLVTVQLAHRQRHETVPAGIGHRHRVPGSGAVQHERSLAYGARQQAATYFGVPGRGVPGVQWEHDGSPPPVVHVLPSGTTGTSGFGGSRLARTSPQPPCEVPALDTSQSVVRSGNEACVGHRRHAVGPVPPAPGGRLRSRQAMQPPGMSPMNDTNDSQSCRQ